MKRFIRHYCTIILFLFGYLPTDGITVCIHLTNTEFINFYFLYQLNFYGSLISQLGFEPNISKTSFYVFLFSVETSKIDFLQFNFSQKNSLLTNFTIFFPLNHPICIQQTTLYTISIPCAYSANLIPLITPSGGLETDFHKGDGNYASFRCLSAKLS